jgi:hypothetical protein
MTDQNTPGQDFLFWIKAALPWAILHFGVVFTISYVTNNNAAAIGVATWLVVIASGAVHYNRGLKDGLRQAEGMQDG